MKDVDQEPAKPEPSADAFLMFERFWTAEAPGELGRSTAKFGRFDVLAEVGFGGQGRVLQAHDPQLSRRVALKLLHATRLLTEDGRRRFEREGRLAARVEHPNVCPVLEAGSVDGQPYLATAWIDGVTLTEWRSGDHDTSINAALRMALAVARGVEAIHRAGVLHRDLKPSNVLVTEGERPVVVDFGLAGDLTEQHSRLTATGDAFGTPGYMAPEQCGVVHEPVDERADVFALAVLTFELLSGETPFARGSMGEYQDALRSRRMRSIRDARRHCPRSVETLLHRALTIEPRDRVASVRAFAADLERCLDGDRVRTRRLSVATRTRRWIEREPWLAAAVVGIIAVLTVGIVLTRIEAARARQNAYDAAIVAASAHIDRGEVIAAWRRLHTCAEELRDFEWDLLRSIADPAYSRGPVDNLRLDAAEPGRIERATPPYRVVDWLEQPRTLHDPERRILRAVGFGRGVIAGVFSPENNPVATTLRVFGGDGANLIYELEIGREVAVGPIRIDWEGIDLALTDGAIARCSRDGVQFVVGVPGKITNMVWPGRLIGWTRIVGDDGVVASIPNWVGDELSWSAQERNQLFSNSEPVRSIVLDERGMPWASGASGSIRSEVVDRRSITPPLVTRTSTGVWLASDAGIECLTAEKRRVDPAPEGWTAVAAFGEAFGICAKLAAPAPLAVWRGETVTNVGTLSSPPVLVAADPAEPRVAFVERRSANAGGPDRVVILDADRATRTAFDVGVRVTAIAWEPDADELWLGGVSGTVSRWSRHGEQIERLEVAGAPIGAVLALPGGSRLVAVDVNAVHIVDRDRKLVLISRPSIGARATTAAWRGDRFGDLVIGYEDGRTLTLRTKPGPDGPPPSLR